MPAGSARVPGPGRPRRLHLAPPALTCENTATIRREHGANCVDGGVKWSKVEDNGGAVVSRRSQRIGEVARRVPGHAHPPAGRQGPAVPARRSSASALADGLVVTRGQERCLYVFPMDEFDRVAEQMRAAPVDQQGGPRLPARVPLRRLRRGARTSRAGSPSRRCCASTPASTRDCTVIGAGRGSRSGTPPPGTTTSRATEQAFAEQAEEVVPGLLVTRSDHPTAGPRPDLRPGLHPLPPS